MKSDIILAGVGGQGILSIAAAIGMAAIDAGLHLKQAEVHGMSQRGGAVQSHLRISDQEIASDLIPKGEADLIISVEPMESLRYLPFLSKDGWIVTNKNAFVNIPDYPEETKVMAEIKAVNNHVIIDADDLARTIKSPRSSNMVMLGAAGNYIELSEESLVKGIRSIFQRKGEEITRVNIQAFKAGKIASEEYVK